MRCVAVMIYVALAGACVSAPAPSALMMVQPAAIAPAAPLDLSTGRPVVTLALPGGQSGQFILDTGSQGAVLKQSVADKLKLEVIGEALLGSPAGGAPQKVFIVNLGDLNLAGAQATKTEAVVAPDQTLPADGGDGVLAPTQWGTQVVTIDLGANTVSMRQQPPADLQTWQPISLRNQTEAEIEVAGVKLRAHIDTGNPRGLVLPLAMAKTLGVSDKLQPTKPIRYVDVSKEAFIAPVDLQLKVGGVTVTVKEATFSGEGPTNIGAGALKGFTVVLDNPRRRWAIAGPA